MWFIVQWRHYSISMSIFEEKMRDNSCTLASSNRDIWNLTEDELDDGCYSILKQILLDIDLLFVHRLLHTSEAVCSCSSTWLSVKAVTYTWNKLTRITLLLQCELFVQLSIQYFSVHSVTRLLYYSLATDLQKIRYTFIWFYKSFQ